MKKLFGILAAAAVAAIGALTPHVSLAGTVRAASEPWVTNKVAQAAADVLDDAEDYTDAAVSNLEAQVEAQIATNAYAIAENRIQIATNAVDIASLKTGKQNAISDLETIRSGAALGATALQEHQSLTNYFTKGESDGRYLQSYTESDPTIYSWAKASTKPAYSYSEISGTPDLDEFATTNQLEASDRLIIDLISSTNVLFTVTNVASQVALPSASIQYATTNGLETVWNELDRHTATLNAAKNYADTSISNSAAYLTSQINSKANKSWSQYTSGLGADAPAGVTWISTPETVIAGGYEYAKTITSGGNVWVLTSNGLQLGQGGSVTNFFQIASADGSPIFRIDKTDAQLVGVDADDIEVVDTTVLVSIALATNTHPYARVSTNLVYNATAWYKEDENGMPAGSPATVSWTGTSGAWVCTADFGQSDNGYLYFEFLQPGETKIVNCGLTDLSGGVIFEGVKYYPVAENGELKFKVQSP